MSANKRCQDSSQEFYVYLNETNKRCQDSSQEFYVYLNETNSDSLIYLRIKGRSKFTS